MEKASSQMANALVHSVGKVSVVTIFKKKHFFKLQKEISLYEPKTEVTRLNILGTIKYLRQNIKSINPDTILVYNKFYGALVAVSLVGVSIPFFISERSSPFYKWGGKLNLFNKVAFAINSPMGIMVQTEEALKFQEKYYRSSRLAVIPNILEKPVLEPIYERQNFILAVGRLNDPLKGFDRLIIALSKVKNNWPLFIVGGNANEDKSLTLLIDQLNLKDRVVFKGKQNNVSQFYKQAGIFVIPSRSEGFPNVLIEAMSYGAPCVSFDFSSGPKEIIDNQVSGVLIDEGDTEKLAQAIDQLIENENHRKKIGDVAKIESKKYGEEFITSKLFDLIFLNA